PRPERSSGNSANARQNSSYKPVFLETGLFKRDKTVQFSSVPFIAKKGMINWPCRAPGGLEMRLWPENKGGLFQAKTIRFSGKTSRICLYRVHTSETGGSGWRDAVVLGRFSLYPGISALPGMHTFITFWWQLR